MINMSLNEIRGRIQFYPEVWMNMYTTNCYAYALGLDISEDDICLNAYQPGTISNTSNIVDCDIFSKRELISGIKGDLRSLGINYRRIRIDDEISDDEWKIALLLLKCERDHSFEDFHFLRQNQDKYWIYKCGYGGSISIKDCNEKVITDPTTAYFYNYEYDRCYALSMKKR